MKVYKYYPLQFDAALKAGFVYINTFENIRRIESSNLIGDMNEATATNSVDISFDPSDPLMASAATNATYGMMDFTRFNAMGVFITNSSFTATLPDAYMYCVTSERNDEFWAETCGYEKCLEILDLYEYSKKISIALGTQIGEHHFYVKKCTYDQRMENITNEHLADNAPSYFKKTSEFQEQKEIRAVIVPGGRNLITNRNTRRDISLNPKTLYVGISGINFIS